jgi:hypothetical protein
VNRLTWSDEDIEVTKRGTRESNACHNPSGANGGQFCGSGDAHMAFEHDLAAHGFPNPINNSEFVIGSEAGVQLTPTPDGYRINHIRSFAPRTGAGGRAMATLLALADKHQLVLTGGAKRFKTGQQGTMTTAALRQWYKKLGFTVSRNGDITRHPK